MATKRTCDEGSSAYYEAFIERYKQQMCIGEILSKQAFSHPPASVRAAIPIKLCPLLQSRSFVVTCVLCFVAFKATWD
jgi:hypothetical protein